MGLGKRGKGWCEGVMDCSGVSLKACPRTGPATQEQVLFVSGPPREPLSCASLLSSELLISLASDTR